MISIFQTEDPQFELEYFPLPGLGLADVKICKNERVVTNDQGQRFFEYDCNQFRTSLSKEEIESNLDFYFAFSSEPILNNIQRIQKLEEELKDTQLALTEIYELIGDMSNG